MKRLIPLWITALGGFVLIVAYFIPATQGWGEVAAIWFDVLAAIAFILGGGNLLKIHLKAMSDKSAGWGYSGLTIVSFLLMLGLGLLKIGATPAPIQEFHGERFEPLALEDVPVTFEQDIAIPGDIEEIHDSVRDHVSVSDDGKMVYRGWMRRDQRAKLFEHDETLAWRCACEELYTKTQPTGELARRIMYYANHQSLSFKGHMTDAQRDALLTMSVEPAWNAAVNALYDATQDSTGIVTPGLPPNMGEGDLPDAFGWDAASSTLSVTGPMTPSQLDALSELYPIARPLDDAGRAALLADIRSRGDLSPEQVEVFGKVMAGQWTVNQLVDTLNVAGLAETSDKTNCEMYAEQQQNVAHIEPQKTVGVDVALSDAQTRLIIDWVNDPAMMPSALLTRLQSAGTFKDAQADAFTDFMNTSPTVGERYRTLAVALMKTTTSAGTRQNLTTAQRDFLLDDYREQSARRQDVGNLMIAAHVVQYPMSGEYRGQGTPFWWLYEFAFKPLQATIFAMLAFYVASAAFLAFRAKNTEAVLLLGTAFIILLGRTFAGVLLTAWVPEWAGGLKIERMTVYIMQVFNTAGNRAIMIGIALGIASTSLKVLLGVDRSYLGSSEE